VAHAQRIGRFEIRDIHSALHKLIELGCIQVQERTRQSIFTADIQPESGSHQGNLEKCNVDVTSTSHARTATNGRDGRNGRNERNERKEYRAAGSELPETDASDSSLNASGQSVSPEEPGVQLNFEKIYEQYPQRDGSHRKKEGMKTCTKNFATPELYADLEKAVKNYYQHCLKRKKIGTPYVFQFGTFVRGQWEEWVNPPPLSEIATVHHLNPAEKRHQERMDLRNAVQAKLRALEENEVAHV
jgi:hypothetical protein